MSTSWAGFDRRYDTHQPIPFQAIRFLVLHHGHANQFGIEDLIKPMKAAGLEDIVKPGVHFPNIGFLGAKKPVA